MKTWLRVQAPFASFRWMQAGGYQASSPTITPTAAWGLLLNLASIEVRGETRRGITCIRPDAPVLVLALGDVQTPGSAVLLQHIHGYPGTVAERATRLRNAHGTKFHIAPVRREILVGLDLVLGFETEDDALRERIRGGLAGELPTPRYGLPFAGENNFMLDRVGILDEPLPARWYVMQEPGVPVVRGSRRLTVGIDRVDSSRTFTRLFAPTREPLAHPPPAAWVRTPQFAERGAGATP